METFEAAKVVYSRISESEPEDVTRKIIGYIYLHDHADKEMVRLAFGPDHLIYALINRAKIDLQIGAKPIISPPRSPCLQFTPFSPPSPQPFSSPVSGRVPTPYWDQQLANDQQFACPNSVHEEFRYQNPPQFMGLEDQLEPIIAVISSLPNDYYFPAEPPLPNVSIRGRRQSLSLPEFPVKVCHYFNKGFCKHGSNCRYFHGGPSFPESYSHTFDEVANKDLVFSPGSLEKLELEITEILKSRRGNPVSVASLPMIYYEIYGRTLQAEGYLTERQMHGWESSRLLRQQLIEEEEVALELDRLHLSKLQMAQKPAANQFYFGYLDELKVSEDPVNFPSAERLNYRLDVLKTGPLSDDNSKPVAANYSDQDDSQGPKLPDSPFASTIISGISAAT